MAFDKDDEEVVRVAELFADVARSLAAPGDLQEQLERIVNLAVEQLDACEFAGISLVEGRQITSPASSNDLPRIVDAIQSELGEGPCIDTIREHEVFQTGNLPAEARWPNFAARAHEEAGVRSILALRLFVEGDTMGALNLYSTRRDAFDETDVALASVFAAHAAVAMASTRREEQLERKAASRDLIGRAKGILMAQSGVDDARAFDMLRRASQRLNVKLVDVAERVVDPRKDEPALG
ncbi:MAG: GAF and ANTAR domain-containing protein [Actinomycetota bacterium]|nr:GAF and ANTAR domain-containing protein [Actinomycetota bacterium]